MFDSFKSKYPKLWEKVKAYDELSIDIERKKMELQKVLAAEVKDVVPGFLKEYDKQHFVGGIVKYGVAEKDIVPDQFVEKLIFPAIEQKPPQISPSLALFWDFLKTKFLELTKKGDAGRFLEELKQLAQRSYEDGVKLAAELSELREQLGEQYKIPRDDFFPKPPPIVLTP